MADGADDARGDGAAADPNDLDFEDAIGRLEGIVDDLESGRAADADLDLDRALALYEEGVGLVRACRERLEDAEQRLETLDVEDGPSDGTDAGATQGVDDDGDGSDGGGSGPNETLGGPE